MVEIDNVRKSFQDLEVLKGISLKIRDHEIYGIIGQSGAGKSTLLRCINGLEPYDYGTIRVDGKKVSATDKRTLRELQKQMGMIFQGFNLLERLNVYDNIALPMKFWGKKTNTPEAKEKILNLIKLVGLEDKAGARPRELSGGQKQRVAIARALVLEPRFLLCDEATSALDPEITKGILSLLQRINQELGITVIIVTHQMEVVKQICRRVAFLSNGVVLAEGRPEELFVKPERREIREFLHEESALLPSDGINIQLFFTGKGSEEPVVTQMARELDTNFSISWAKLEDFRKNVYGSLVITVKEEDKLRVTEFLDKKGVTWEVIEKAVVDGK
ncbi:MAG: methionine ABC transporter ATP-binding protein [Lachnospiraceae bacterium]|nr:methionine ABC transporter ATP-binding protein [Lachnospiraceae bacterium]